MAKIKTGLGIAAVSGSSGGAVFVTRRDGSTLVRERPSPVSGATPAQRQARETFARASAAWRTLSLAEQQAWLDWARATDPFAGASGAANAYRSLVVRWLGFHGTGAPSSFAGDASCPENEEGVGGGDDPPRLPPATPFGGDAVMVTVEGLSARLRFTADRANAEGVGTELLAARVVSALAQPRDRDYRAVGRADFDSSGESVDVPMKRGRYAVAVRFVRLATGQATDVLRCGVVEVGA